MKKAESRLNVDITDVEQKLWNPIVMRLDAPKSLVNDYLNGIELEFKKFLTFKANELRCTSVQQLRDKILIGDDLQPFQRKVLVYIEEYYSEQVEKRSTFSKGTKKNYLKAIKHWQTFSKVSSLNEVTFGDFELKYAVLFKSYLTSEKPDQNRKGMTEVSASSIIKKMRTIFAQAVDEELLAKNYFKKIKLSNKSPEKARLSIDQISRLYHMDKSNLSGMEKLALDLILFSSFTGLAYKDVMALHKSYLEYRNDGLVKLIRPRIKTNEVVEQFLIEPAIKLIEKYHQFADNSGRFYIFPSIENSTYNKTLKLLAAKCDISLRLTTHTGRHSFRQLLSEAGIEDIAVIKRMMGQKNRDVMDSIYYKVTDSKLMEAKNKFETYIIQHLHGLENLG